MKGIAWVCPACQFSRLSCFSPKVFCWRASPGNPCAAEPQGEAIQSVRMPVRADARAALQLQTGTAGRWVIAQARKERSLRREPDLCAWKSCYAYAIPAIASTSRGGASLCFAWLSCSIAQRNRTSATGRAPIIRSRVSARVKRTSSHSAQRRKTLSRTGAYSTFRRS